MEVVLQYTEDEHCREVTDFKKFFEDNEQRKKLFPEVEFKSEKVTGSNYFMINIYYDGQMKSIPAVRLDLVEKFLREYYKIKMK